MGKRCSNWVNVSFVAMLSVLPVFGGRTVSSRKGASPDDVVVQIGTHALRKDQFKGLVDYCTAEPLARLKMPSVGATGPEDTLVNRNFREKKIRRNVAQAASRKVLVDYIRNVLLADYAVVQGLSADRDTLKVAQDGVSSYLVRRPKAEKFRDFLNQDAETRSLAAVAERTLLKTCDDVVDDATVTRVIANIAKYNERIAATNALVAATATNAWRAASVDGADFTAVANRFLGEEMTDEDYALSPLVESDLDGEIAPGAMVLFKSLREGAVAPPIAADNGYLVVKLLRREKDEDGMTYHLASARFALAIPAQNGTPDEIRSRLLLERREKFMQDKIKELARAAGVKLFGQEWMGL